MDQVYLWCVTGMSALLTVNTLWRLWSERQRLGTEDLNDSDRAFAWRIVIFLVFPLLTFLDLRSTMVSCQWLGGYIKSWSYGLFWYHCLPAGLPSYNLLLAVLFAGVGIQLAMALCLLPALLFRPHPFLATVIGYSVAFVFGFNLLIDPVMCLAGLGSPRWQLLYSWGSNSQRLLLFALHASALLVYLSLLRSKQVKLWFAGLSRPVTSDQLKKALCELKATPNSLGAICRVGTLYDQAGLKGMASKQLQSLHQLAPHSLYFQFLNGLLNYHQRNYATAQQAFLDGAEALQVEGLLKANLLSAAACCAFAAGQITQAINLSQRALELSQDCIVARMVKVDVLMQQGHKDLAGQEILLAMKAGMTTDLENKIPLDAEFTLELICRLEDKAAAPSSREAVMAAR